MKPEKACPAAQWPIAFTGVSALSQIVTRSTVYERETDAVARDRALLLQIWFHELLSS
jgi:hypothetical protein